VEVEVKEKMKPVEELKLNSLYKCRELATITMVSWSLELQMYLGNLTLLFVVVSKSVFTFLFQTFMLVQFSLRLELERLLIT
jgi:hypothetical protein